MTKQKHPIAKSIKNIQLAKDDKDLDLGDDNTPKWQHVAIEGQYLGYRDGLSPFELTRQSFAEMVANLRADPSYQPDANGVGMSPVVPWDFEHASELYPADGTIPSEGVPAQGWILDLKIQTSPDGKAELWALSSFLDTAREYIKNNQYRWSSISADLNAVDGKTGKRIGALLTSVALTNQPFIRGLKQIAASAMDYKTLSSSGWFDAANNPKEAIESVKDLLGLRELASYQEVMLEIEKLREMVVTGNTPLGVDIGKIIGIIRKILNMGALSPANEVLDAISNIGQRAIEGDVMDQGKMVVSPPLDTSSNAATTLASEKGEDMDLKVLANKMGVKEIETEVNAAIDDVLELRTDTASIIGCSAKTPLIKEEIISLVAVKESHTTLLSALGAKDGAEAVLELGKLQKAAKELEDLKPEHLALSKRIEDIDEEKANADVELVIAANKFDPSLKEALLLSRKNDPEKFAEKFPVDPTKIELTQNLTGENNQSSTVGEEVDVTSGNVIDLSAFPGKNKSAKVKNYLSSKNPSFKEYDFDQQSLLANKCIRENRFVE